MKKKFHRLGTFVPKIIPNPNHSIENFGYLARVNDQKSMLKSLLRWCSCNWCSIHWLKEFKK